MVRDIDGCARGLAWPFYTINAIDKKQYRCYYELTQRVCFLGGRKVDQMSRGKEVKELREKMGMNRREFSEYYGIPYRTVQDWEAEKRELPDYLLRLLKYRAEIENRVKKETSTSLEQQLYGNKPILYIYYNNMKFSASENLNY